LRWDGGSPLPARVPVADSGTGVDAVGGLRWEGVSRAARKGATREGRLGRMFANFPLY
jgi:hypothetical protein